MGQATRTTKLFLTLGKRDQGGANTDKQAALTATVEVLNVARTFYVNFFLAHADKLAERVPYYSEEHLEMRERLLSAHELLTWAEACTVETASHRHPWTGWNFTKRFGGMPFAYRRSVIKFEANADFNASVNVHRSFYREWHWQPRIPKKASPSARVEDSA